jgi:hypothetical protein
MRYALVRAWSVAATAILAAAVSDAITEFAENSGWLGGLARDDQHEAILPTLLVGAVVALGLVAFALFARVPARDRLLRPGGLGGRLFEIVTAYCASMAAVVAMEGYETRFGGLSPFDPRSVVLSHTLALVVCSIVIGAIVHCALRSALRVASRASGAVVEFVAAFLRRLVRTVAASPSFARSAFVADAARARSGIGRGLRGLRAPPASIRSHLIAT